jgi:uncharacterized damage-inducible protein DinB
MSEKDVFLNTYEREFNTTMKVLKAFPHESADLQPHARCKTAKDLAWTFVIEEGLLESVLKGQIDFSQPTPKAPGSLDEVLAALQKQHRGCAEKVRSMSDDEFNAPITFPVGPGKMGEQRRGEVLWMLLMDGIHHRGQFSIYLRMADGKVPSIYGPSGDEPWF